MILTEEQARTKWCPFARPDQTVSLDGIIYARKGDCIASDCMAWRWATLPPERQLRSETSKTANPVPGKGFCGLARWPDA